MGLGFHVLGCHWYHMELLNQAELYLYSCRDFYLHYCN